MKFKFACVVLMLAGVARGDMIVNSFDQYAPGQRLDAIDSWSAWNNVLADAATISNAFAYSGSNSLQIGGAYTDGVKLLSATTGSYTLTAQMYLPSGQTGQTYFIMMNRYVVNGNNDPAMWSVQLNFNLGAGRVTDDFRGGSVPIAFDRWVPITISIDLDANTLRQYYNGALIAQGSWTTGTSSVRQAQALDLFTHGGNTAYYDDITFAAVPAPGPLAMAASAMLLVWRRRPQTANVPSRGL
ncbi:MAG: hypothetical protein GC200_08070 [Tepidisphaera sp.]|nr:hypothetical protein [Tepidisphaera sp.]